MKKSSEIEIAIHAKLKNGPLWRLVQKYGSVKNMAEALGIVGYGYWVELVSLKRSIWKLRKDKRDAIAEKLFFLTGKTLNEIFPIEAPKVREHVFFKDITQDSLNYEQHLMLPSPEDLMIRAENEKAEDDELEYALDGLTRNQKKSLASIAEGATFKEIAEKLGVSKSRVGQLRAKALRKMRERIYRRRKKGSRAGGRTQAL